MLLSTLLAVSLQFGSVREPIVAIEVHDVRLVDVPLDATSGMTKTRVGDSDVYYRLPSKDAPNIDVIVAAHGRLLRLVEPPRFEGTQPPLVVLVTGDVIHLELSSSEKRLALFIDLRGEPRATYVEATQAFGHGTCGVPDALFSPHTAMTCEWNHERGDFVCRQARLLLRDWGLRTAWRSFTLFGRETITNPKDVSAPAELLSGGERIFTGEGFVEVIPIADGIDFYAIPSTDRLFALHGWLVDHKAKRVVPVMTTMLEQPLRGPAQYSIDNDPPFTADHVHLKTKTLPPIGGDGLIVVPFTVTDANATALFWLGYDGTSASLLRVATDAEEYLSCNVLVRPASAISEPFVEKAPPFAATFHVAGPAPRYADLDLHLLDDTSCGYDSRVTWKQGFVARRKDATHCKPSERKKLTVLEDGRVVTAVLPPSP